METKRIGLPYINTKAYERPDTAGGALDEALDRAREAYTTALNDIMDRVAEEFEQAGLEQYPVQDMALFGMFLASIKMVELAGQPMERRQILSAFNYLLKRAEREVPEQILSFVKNVLKEGPAA